MMTESHYRPKKQVTILMQKPVDIDDSDEDDEADARPTRTKLPGMVVIGVETSGGTLRLTY